jgi:hypothetical protein
MVFHGSSFLLLFLILGSIFTGPHSFGTALVTLDSFLTTTLAKVSIATSGSPETGITHQDQDQAQAQAQAQAPQPKATSLGKQKTKLVSKREYVSIATPQK